MPVFTSFEFRKDNSFLTEVNNTDFNFLFKLWVLDCTFNAFDYSIENAQFNHYLTQLNANDYFDNVCSFKMVKLVLNDKIDDSFCSDFCSFQVCPVNSFVDLKLHTTDVTCGYFSASIKLKIWIDVSFASVTSERAVEVHWRNVIGSKRSNPCSKWENWLFWCIVDYYAGWPDEMGPGIIVIVNMEQILRRWEGWKALSVSILFIDLDSIVWREDRSRHLISFVFLSFLVHSCLNESRRVWGLLRWIRLSLLSISVWFFIEMSQSVCHWRLN